MRLISSLMMIAILAVSACSGDERDFRLRDLRTAGNGPDEFSVLPSKNLTAPDNYTTLPAPTPGGANITDQNPQGDAVAALGGNPARLANSGVPAGDAALVRHATRQGVDPSIRATTAAEDEQFRKRKSRFTKIRIVRTDRYSQSYRRQSIDQRKELERWRRAGVRTPTAPPPWFAN